MDMRDWLSIIFIAGLVLIVLDGFRVKWLERRRSLRIKLDKNIPSDDNYSDDNHELPNGGARLVAGDDAPYYGSNESTTENSTANSTDTSFNNEDDFEENVPVLMETVELEEEELVEPIDREWDETERESAIDDEVDEFVASLVEEQAKEQVEEDAVGQVRARERNQNSLDEDDFERASPTLVDHESSDRIEPSFGDTLSENDFLEEPMKPSPVEEQKAQPVSYTKEDQTELFMDYNETQGDDLTKSVEAEVQEVIVLNVMAKAGELLTGKELLPILMQQGMHLGDMSIFHRHGDSGGSGPVMFSMANMVEPGTFDVSKMEEFTTPGISFFLQMPNSFGNMKCFEQMLDAANAVKNGLDCDLKDEDRNIITLQTIEHCRETVRDFELKQYTNK